MSSSGSPRIRNTAPRLQRPITRKGALETLQLKDSLVCAEGEHVEKSLQTILGEDTNPSSHSIGTTDKETSTVANCKADQKSSDSVKLVFIPEEDECIKRGIEKYGNL